CALLTRATRSMRRIISVGWVSLRTHHWLNPRMRFAHPRYALYAAYYFRRVGKPAHPPLG
ncbi:hypothetical protein ACRDEO_002053, partial [Cronobacter malonaticus]